MEHVLLLEAQIEKKKITGCCFLSLCSHTGSLFSLTQELIKPDSLWSPSCCLCKQLGKIDHFNVRLWLIVIRCLCTANSFVNCFLLWFHFHWNISNNLTATSFSDSKEPTIKAEQRHRWCSLIWPAISCLCPSLLHLVLELLNCNAGVVFIAWKSLKQSCQGSFTV